MSADPTSEITQLLSAAGNGDGQASGRLWNLIYDELRAIARNQIAAERAGHTLQPTALVHEAFVKLIGNQEFQWTNRRHFFAAAANAMRQIRIDDARRRKRLKRGGGQAAAGRGWGGDGSDGDGPAESVEGAPWFDPDPDEVLAVNEAMQRLERLDARKAEVVKLRYYAGLSVDETAAALGISPRTVDLDWQFARAWLHRELSRETTALTEP